MLTRRAFFYWQIIGAFLLPSWVLVGRGIIDDGVGWDFVLYLVLCPILCVVMLAVAGLTVARKKVRTARAVSWARMSCMVSSAKKTLRRVSGEKGPGCGVDPRAETTALIRGPADGIAVCCLHFAIREGRRTPGRPRP